MDISNRFVHSAGPSCWVDRPLVKQRIESANRTDQSHRCIEAMNRINESNTQTIQSDPQKIQDDRPRPSKEGPRAPKSGPRPAQDGPKDAQDPPKRTQEQPRTAQDPPKGRPRTPPEPSWDGLGAILGPSNSKIEIKIENYQSPFRLWGRFGLPNGFPNEPKSIPKRDKNQDDKLAGT